jgi:peroxiredoxin
VFVTYHGEKLAIGDGVDVGYAVEKTALVGVNSDIFVIPTRGVTSLVVCLPFVDETNLAELVRLDAEFADKSVEGFEALVVIPKGVDAHSLSFFKTLRDECGEFGEEFGVLIEDGFLVGKFAKALFVISRDNILFYKEICRDIEDSFNEERLYMQTSKALGVYSGTGCH